MTLSNSTPSAKKNEFNRKPIFNHLFIYLFPNTTLKNNFCLRDLTKNLQGNDFIKIKTQKLGEIQN
ncbi:hypothetical protein BpHYR1_011175 [Brachionus plicatilis]|uniref:Uncharacterized protein n=1 Tax=Brachionus plicatilis TaxID=10195 RepID=A0A3M7QE67_BRAPC|nr:hypothetical protein BpHYR1_011175 [Brachionus plicatilis]